MLSSLPVMHPGRVPRPWPVVPFVLAVLAVAVHTQSPTAARPPWRDVVRELAAKLAPSLSRTEPFDVVVRLDGSALTVDAGFIEAEMAAALKARGLRASPAADTNGHVMVTCGESLRDLVCAAEVARGGNRLVHLAARPRKESEQVAAPPATVLTLTPLFAQSRPLLDLTLLSAQQIVVLDVDAVTLYERSEPGWHPKATHRFIGAPSWPRDVRGRLVVRGPAIDAHLPGYTCRGTLEPFALSCSSGRGAWPLGLDNDGMVEGRNYFTSPRIGPFYSAAPVGSGATSSWVFAGVDGSLRVKDSSGSELASLPHLADDLVALTNDCKGGRRVVLAAVGTGTGRPTHLRAWEVWDRGYRPVTELVTMPGALSALWPSSEASMAVAITRAGGSDRYEAFHVGLACAR